ncbi:hypothetical protein CPL00136_CDS0120 [Salmonella phage vB_SenS-3]
MGLSIHKPDYERLSGIHLISKPAFQFLSCFWVNKKLSQILASGRSNESISKS